MHDSTSLLVKILVIILIVIIGVALISGIGLKIFKSKKKRTKSTSDIKPPQNLSITLRPNLQNTDFRKGKTQLHIQHGAICLAPLDHDSILRNIYINDQDIFKFRVSDTQSGKEISFPCWEDKLFRYKLDSLNSNSDVWITEGGLFTENDITPTTTFHFASKKSWAKDDEIVFVKMAFPNSTLPYTDISEDKKDNTIAIYHIPSDSKNLETSVTVPGIPRNSKLTVVVRKEKDGPERIVDVFKLSSPSSELWVSSTGISFIPN